MPGPFFRVPKHIGLAGPSGAGPFLDVPAYALADAGKALTVNPAGDGYVYAAFATPAEAAGYAAAAVAAHVLEGDPHTQYHNDARGDARYPAVASYNAHVALTTAHGISAFGATVTGAASQAAGRAALGLGTAAVLDHGVAAGNVVQLDGTAKLPAVDGSQLTNLPGGGGGTPGGSVGQVQVHGAGGVFVGDAGLTYDVATDVLSVTGGVTLPVNAKIQWGASGRIPYVRGNSSTFFEVGDNIAGAFFYYNVVTKALQGAHMESLRFPSSGNLTLLGNDAPKDFIQVQGAGHTILIANHYGNFRVTNNGGSAQLNIDSSGLVAIGQSSATALLDIAASTTARASLRVRSGVAPTSPNDGDIWYDGTHFYGRAAGATKQLDN